MAKPYIYVDIPVGCMVPAGLIALVALALAWLGQR